MAITTNTDIDYINKDAASALDALINFATVNFGANTSANRLWTDFNIDSFSRNWVEIVAYIADCFYFYLDVQSTQAYLQTANVVSAVNDIAKQFGFVPASATSASGQATFTVTGAVTIPRGFRVRSSNNEDFYTTTNIVAAVAGDYTGTVIQGIIKNESFVAQGLQNETLTLAGPNVILDLNNINPLDITPQVTVNGSTYTLVNTFIYSNGSDLPAIKDVTGNVIGGGGRVFKLSVDSNNNPIIEFGDGVFGRKLNSGDNISIQYRTGGGTSGNIGAGTLTILVDSLNQVSSVTNGVAFSGGADAQTIDQLRDLIPASLRTLNRAVTLQDYSDLLEVNFTEVQAASASIADQAGVDLNVYVVPQGTGITKITDNTVLLNTLTNFLDIRKMVTTQFQILDAFGVAVLITLDLYINNTSSKTTVQQAVLSALDNYFSLTTGGPNGSGVSFSTDILFKDINNVIQTISGIDRFEIKRLTYRPRIQDNIVGLLTTYNSSNVTVFPSVDRAEWLAGAAGPKASSSGSIVFSNSPFTSYTYNSGTGVITYSGPVNLTSVAPGDQFRDGSSTDYGILAVNSDNYTVTLNTGLSITTGSQGSIRTGSYNYNSFKVYKKILATATSLSVNSISDSENLDFSVVNSIGSAIGARLLLDNSKVFIPNQYATGKFYLVDGAGNIWDIISNTSDTLTTSVTSVNDGSITSVAGGNYSIVEKLANYEVIFNNNIASINYNNVNTIFSIGGEFNNIGVIGQDFQISKVQSNIGNLGTAVDIISYNAGKVQLNGTPDLTGLNSGSYLIDRSGQIFNISSLDNRNTPETNYDTSFQNAVFIPSGSGADAQIAQGFKIPTTGLYSAVSFFLKRDGNIVGNLSCAILNDSAGLPNSSSVVATTTSTTVTSISNTDFELVTFTFTSPPSLTSGTQYHLALIPDASYVSSYVNNNTIVSNTGLNTFTYNSGTGVVTYSTSPSPVDLTAVVVGNYFEDSVGNLFEITSVSPATYQINIGTGQSVSVTAPSTANQGSIIQNDRIEVGTSTTASYPNGVAASYNSTSNIWTNISGPQDAIFSVQGTKSITVDSNLTPVLGTGATISNRYYDDNNEISFILGISNGVTVQADVVGGNSTLTAIGTATVGSVANQKVDNFVFRTSPYNDDIINLRANEIPQLNNSDTIINIFGGVE